MALTLPEKKLILDPEMKTEMQLGGWLILCGDGENGLLPRRSISPSVNDGSTQRCALREPPTPQICDVFCLGEE